MTEQNFTDVMTEVFKHEGGYVNDKRDAGGETNFGISKRAHPDVDIKNMTKTTARSIYRHSYWGKVKAGYMPDGLDLVLMDASVNSGTSRGPKWLQSALGVNADGRIGPKTIAAANSFASAGGIQVIQDACGDRMGFLRGLRSWSVFKGGWSARVASVEAVSVRMWLAASNAAPTREILVGLGEEAGAAGSKQRKTAAATGGGSGAVGIGGDVALDPMMITAIVVILGIVAVIVYGRSRNNAIRAKAYEAEAGKMEI